MATRNALRLKRVESGGQIRSYVGQPGYAAGDEFTDILRADIDFTPPDASVGETYLLTDPLDYTTAQVSFSPTAVPAVSGFGTWSVLSIVRSQAGFPLTNLDGTEVARYDFTTGVPVSNKALTSNVATLTTSSAHGLSIGSIVIVYGVDSVFDGTYTVASVPTSTTFTYSRTNANVTSVAAVGTVALQRQQVVVINDAGLVSGDWYYYALFARFVVSGTPLWIRMATSDVLMPNDYGYSDLLWERIPEYYRTLDDSQSGAYTEHGLLRKFINRIGFEVDIQRTWVLTIGDIWDASRISSRLLAQLGAMFDSGYEGAVGDKRYRNILNNLMYLRSIKGTSDGLAGYLAALTGYRCNVYVGPNILLSNDDAEQRNSAGSWAAGTNTTVSRITGATETNGPANQNYLRLTNATGGSATVAMQLGSYRNTAVPVTAAHVYTFTFNAKASVTPATITVAFDWYGDDGTLLSTSTPISAVSIVPLGVNIWNTSRFGSALSATAPANAKFLVIRITTSAIASAATVSLFHMQLTDLAWRPQGIAAKQVVAPFSGGAGSNTYDQVSYYESARRIWINLYPQRANLALNANFTLNNLPSGAWINTDPVTYQALPVAYATYFLLAATAVTNKALTSNVATLTTSTSHGLIVGQSVTITGVDATFNGTFSVTVVGSPTTFSYAKTAANVTSVASGGTVQPGTESTYADLLAGYDSMSNLSSLTYDTTNHQLVLDTAATLSPFLSQFSSAYFPINTLTAYSARIEAKSNVAGTSCLLKIKWFTDNIGSEILFWPDGITRAEVDSRLTPITTTDFTTCIVGNAFPPPNALYGRLVVETSNQSSDHTDRFMHALIEDQPVPGAWFDGNSTEGALHDIDFIGTVNQSYSTYYLNRRAILAGTNSSDRVSTVLPLHVPPDRDYVVITDKTQPSLFG